MKRFIKFIVKWFVKIIIYIKTAWEDDKGKVNPKTLLAIIGMWDFVRNLHFAIARWGSDRSLEGLSLVLGIEAGLILGFMGITAYTSLSSNTQVTKTSVEVTKTEPNGAQNAPVEQVAN